MRHTLCVFVPQELLQNKEDYYLRVLRPLWREICRSLRYEVDFLKFCSGLFQDRKVTAWFYPLWLAIDSLCASK